MGPAMCEFYETDRSFMAEIMQMVFYDVKNVLKVLPRMETNVISWGSFLEYVPGKQLGWFKGKNGALNLFSPEFQYGVPSYLVENRPSEEEEFWQIRMIVRNRLLE